MIISMIVLLSLMLSVFDFYCYAQKRFVYFESIQSKKIKFLSLFFMSVFLLYVAVYGYFYGEMLGLITGAIYLFLLLTYLVLGFITSVALFLWLHQESIAFRSFFLVLHFLPRCFVFHGIVSEFNDRLAFLLR